MGVRLHFIVEGQTEETFVNETLKPHLSHMDIWADVRCVLTSRRGHFKNRGGISNYAMAKRDIKSWTRQDQNTDAHFTTMFDLYRLPTDFPGYKDVPARLGPFERVRILEDAFGDDIGDRRFTPYIQLHEFEALLFSDPEKFAIQFPDKRRAIQQLVKMSSGFESPEHIDSGSNTAPSKRIISVIGDYRGSKATAGPLVAKNIGLSLLRSKCRHFGEWLSSLEALSL